MEIDKEFVDRVWCRSSHKSQFVRVRTSNAEMCVVKDGIFVLDYGLSRTAVDCCSRRFMITMTCVILCLPEASETFFMLKLPPNFCQTSSSQDIDKIVKTLVYQRATAFYLTMTLPRCYRFVSFKTFAFINY